MLEIQIVFRARDDHNSVTKAVMLIGRDGSVAISRYGRPNKMYLKKTMPNYDRLRGWDLIYQALKQVLGERDETDDGLEREGSKKEERNKIQAKGKSARAKNKKVPRKPGV
jgi:hypothetical protein